MRRLLVLTAVLLVVVLLLAACQATPTATPTKPPATATPVPSLSQPTATPQAAAAASPTATKPAATATVVPATPTPAPKSSGKITIVLAEEPWSLEHTQAHSEVNIPPIRNIEEALLNRDPKTMELIGELATKWEQTNPTIWRFTLRKGVKYHNGEDFEAAGAAFGIDRSWSKELNSALRTFIGPEVKAKVVDASTVDVETASADPILPLRMYFAALPAPKHAKENPEELSIRPIGTGPYKLVEYVKAQYVKMTANEDYWGGAPKIKDVVMTWRTEAAVRAAMVRTGEADFARKLSAEDCGKLPQCASLPSVETLHLRVDVSPLAEGAPQMLADKRVRQAMSYAIDRKAISDRILSGAATPASHMFSPLVNGYNSTLKPRALDIEQAKKLVAEAKAAGVDNSVPLTVIYRSGVMARIAEQTEAVSGMLNAVGFNTKVASMEASQHTQGLRIKPLPGNRLFYHSHSNEMGDASQSIASKYRCAGPTSAVCDKKTEELDDKARAAVGETRTRLYQELMAYLYDEETSIPVLHPLYQYGLSQRLQWQARLDGFILAKEMSIRQ